MSRVLRLTTFVVVTTLSGVVFSSCTLWRPAPSSTARPSVTQYRMPIPDRRDVKEAPKEGWCGETSIQMAALHYGAYLPQGLIHDVGKPDHVDLWEYNLPPAMEALSLEYEQWQPAQVRPSPTDSPDAARSIEKSTFRKDIPILIRWIKYEISQGYPVLIGTKIYPTDYPEAVVDHIMLAVGFTKRGLILNTNSYEHQLEVSDRSLVRQHGYSFVNYANTYFAFAVKGFRLPPQAAPVSLKVTKETKDTVSLNIKIRSLTPGVSYTLTRDDLHGTVTTQTFTATSARHLVSTTVEANTAAKFTCFPSV